MPPLKLIKVAPSDIRALGLDERWVQDRIADDPAQLGLGDLYIRDKERSQPRAGRLDLLLQDSEEPHRYEVEVQLGPSNESHIIRTIEYWDMERKRYPQYEHTAVLIAEDITTRFLNVISLFNGQVPLVAIQMRAFRVEGGIALVFTKVMDVLSRGLVDEDEEVVPADRKYWEARAGEMLAATDRIFALAKDVVPSVEMSYLKGYIGAKVEAKVQNFFTVAPKRTHMRFAFRVPETAVTKAEIDKAGIDLIRYLPWGAYSVRLTAKDVESHRELIKKWLSEAYQHFCA